MFLPSPWKVVLQTQKHHNSGQKQYWKASNSNTENDVGTFALIRYRQNEKNDVSWFRQSRTTLFVCWHLYFRY